MQNRLRSTRVVSQTAWVRSYAVRLAIAAGATSLPLGRLASADTTSRDTPFAHQFDTQSDPQVQAARQTYDTARQHVAELQSKIDQEQKALSDLAQRLSQADVSLSARHEALDNAEKALTEKQLALAEAEKEFESAKAAFEARWHDAIVRFEASGEFQSARSQADNARSNAAAAEDAALDRLGATGAFQRAMAAVNETSNKAQALAARPTNDPDRADAEQTAAEAAGRLAELRSRYLDEDVDVQSARANARAAGSAFDELSRSFRDQMPGLPEIASAKAASDGSASLLKTANQAVADSQVDRDHLAADFEQASAAFAADRATSAKLQGEVTDLNNQLAEANTHADQAQSSLTAALAAAEQNQQAALAFGPPPQPQPSVTVPVPSGVECANGVARGTAYTASDASGASVYPDGSAAAAGRDATTRSAAAGHVSADATIRPAVSGAGLCPGGTRTGVLRTAVRICPSLCGAAVLRFAWRLLRQRLLRPGLLILSSATLYQPGTCLQIRDAWPVRGRPVVWARTPTLGKCQCFQRNSLPSRIGATADRGGHDRHLVA